MNNGWIKLWRKIELNPVFQDSHLFHAFSFCLIRACHEGKDILTTQGQIHLEPGQFITGRKEASRILGFKSIMWDRKLQLLEKLGIVNRKVNSKFTVVTVNNWGSYQGYQSNDEQENEQDVNRTRTGDEQDVNTNKNDKNVKNDKKILSDDEFLASLKEKFTWVDFDQVMIKMDAWLMAKPGRKKTRRFIVNWLNRIEKPMEVGHGGTGSGLDPVEKIRQAMRIDEERRRTLESAGKAGDRGGLRENEKG